MPKITELSAATVLAGAEVLAVVQSAETKKVTFDQLRPFEILLSFVASGTITIRSPYAHTIDTLTITGGSPGTLTVTDDGGAYTINGGATIAADSVLVFTASGAGRVRVLGRRL